MIDTGRVVKGKKHGAEANQNQSGCLQESSLVKNIHTLSMNAPEFVPGRLTVASNSHENTSVLSTLNSIGSHQQMNQINTTMNQQQMPIMTEVDGALIDSALVSALRDPRERKALLKLEQILVDFVSENQNKVNQDDSTFNSLDYIDIGGQGYSIVIRGNNITQNALPNGPKVASVDVNLSMASRQTSFQRLCLHRLADRFGIIRENPSNNSAYPYVNLIRLVRVSSSTVPSPLLIDLDISKVKNPSINQSFPILPQDRGLDTSLEAVPDQVHSLPTSGYDPGDESIENSSRLSKKKVMIMKRSASSNSSRKGDSNNNLLGLEGLDPMSSGSNKFKGKNISDKERAYAEARARIFNTTMEDTDADYANPSEGDTGTHSAAINAEAAFSESALFQALALSETTPSASGTATPQSQGIENASGSLTPVPSGTGEFASDITMTNAGAEGATSKVLWRNRKQEESDPDFRRGFLPVAVMTPSVSSVCASPASYTVSSNVRSSYSASFAGRGHLNLPTMNTHPSPQVVQSHYCYSQIYPNSYPNVPSEIDASAPPGTIIYQLPSQNTGSFPVSSPPPTSERHSHKSVFQQQQVESSLNNAFRSHTKSMMEAPVTTTELPNHRFVHNPFVDISVPLLDTAFARTDDSGQIQHESTTTTTSSTAGSDRVHSLTRQPGGPAWGPGPSKGKIKSISASETPYRGKGEREAAKLYNEDDFPALGR